MNIVRNVIRLAGSNTLLALLGAIAVGSLAPHASAEGNSLVFVNGGAAVVIDNFLAHERGDPTKTQRLGPVKIEANSNAKFVFDQLTCAVRRNVKIRPQNPPGNFDQPSSQEFIGDDEELELPITYPLLLGANTPLRYQLGVDVVIEPGSLPPGTLVKISGGVDTSGTFPPSVVFIDDNSGLPFSGQALSHGDVTIRLAPTPIPTVSEWGLIVMTLLLLTAGTVAIRRAHPSATTVPA